MEAELPLPPPPPPPEMQPPAGGDVPGATEPQGTPREPPIQEPADPTEPADVGDDGKKMSEEEAKKLLDEMLHPDSRENLQDEFDATVKRTIDEMKTIFDTEKNALPPDKQADYRKDLQDAFALNAEIDVIDATDQACSNYEPFAVDLPQELQIKDGQTQIPAGHTLRLKDGKPVKTEDGKGYEMIVLADAFDPIMREINTRMQKRETLLKRDHTTLTDAEKQFLEQTNRLAADFSSIQPYLVEQNGHYTTETQRYLIDRAVGYQYPAEMATSAFKESDQALSFAVDVLIREAQATNNPVLQKELRELAAKAMIAQVVNNPNEEITGLIKKQTLGEIYGTLHENWHNLRHVDEKDLQTVYLMVQRGRQSLDQFTGTIPSSWSSELLSKLKEFGCTEQNKLDKHIRENKLLDLITTAQGYMGYMMEDKLYGHPPKLDVQGNPVLKEGVTEDDKQRIVENATQIQYLIYGTNFQNLDKKKISADIGRLVGKEKRAALFRRVRGLIPGPVGMFMILSLLVSQANDLAKES